MARVWTDGFEFRDLIGYCLSPAVVGVGVLADISTSVKRSGAASLRARTLSSSGGWATYTISDVSEFYLRVGVYIASGSDTVPKIYWQGGSYEGYITFGTCYTLQAYVNDVNVASGVTPLYPDVWYLIEAHIKIDGTVGEVEVRIDGKTALEIDYTGNTGTGNVDTIKFHSPGGGLGDTSTLYFDDIALNDTAGAVDNSWCGEGKIIVMMPDDDSAPLELTPSAASDHHLLVDEIPTDGDTTYVEGSVVDEEDMYGLAASGLVDVDINRVWTEARTRKTAASDGEVALITKASGGAEVSGGDVNF